MRTTMDKACTRVVPKVRGLAVLLRVGTTWRCGDGLFFVVPPLASDALLTTLPPTSQKRAADRWSLRNFLPRSSFFMFRKAQKSHGARSELNSAFSFEKVDHWNAIRTTAIQCRSRPHAISWLFQPWKGSSEATNFEVINGLQHVLEKWVERCNKCIVCQGKYFETRPSPHLHKVPTRSNKVSPRTFQTTLVVSMGKMKHA
jgi:hypothetical protein